MVHCIKGLIGQSDNNREKNPNYFSFRRQEFFGVYNEMDNWKWFACLTLDKTTMTRRTHKNGNIWWSGIFMFYRRNHRTAPHRHQTYIRIYRNRWTSDCHDLLKQMLQKYVLFSHFSVSRVACPLFSISFCIYSIHIVPCGDVVFYCFTISLMFSADI